VAGEGAARGTAWWPETERRRAAWWPERERRRRQRRARSAAQTRSGDGGDLGRRDSSFGREFVEGGFAKTAPRHLFRDGGSTLLMLDLGFSTYTIF
jgi:hypothetical protein